MSWEAFVNGSNNALDEVFIAHYSSMLFTALSYTKDEEKARDIVSDIFSKLLEMDINERQEKLGEVNEKLGNFLKVLVKHKSIDALRVENNRKNILDSIFHVFSRSVEKNNFFEEDFMKMMEVLPKKQRKILELHLQGFSNEEISVSLNISYNTCRNTISTAKKKIRSIWSTFME
jgi:RNA polymerase sigma-70 factor (ECF subfamily)